MIGPTATARVLSVKTDVFCKEFDITAESLNNKYILRYNNVIQKINFHRACISKNLEAKKLPQMSDIKSLEFLTMELQPKLVNGMTSLHEGKVLIKDNGLFEIKIDASDANKKFIRFIESYT